jgi:hypothetical protein
VVWLRASEWNSGAGVLATLLLGATLYWSLLITLDKSIRHLFLDLLKDTRNVLRLQAAKYTS